MFDPKSPAIACESGIWSVPAAPTRGHLDVGSGNRETLWERFSQSRFGKFLKILLLLRHLFSRKQHLILAGFNRIFGDRFRIAIGRTRMVMLSAPEDVQAVLEQDSDILAAGSMRKRMLGVFPKNCLFYATGVQHKSMRRNVARAFGKATQRLDVNQHLLQLVSELKLTAIDCRTQKIEESLIQLAGKVVFGTSDFQSETTVRQMRQSFDRLHMVGLLFPILRLLPRFGQGFKAFRTAQSELLGQIDEAIESGKTGNGFLKCLQQTSTGELSNTEIRDNAAFIFLVLVRTLMPLFRNVAQALAIESNWQQKLRSTGSDEASLYRAVVKETLRLKPFAPVFGRLAQRDVHVNEFRIRKGEFVLISPLLTHSRPESFPQPAKFDPRRFIRSNHRHRFIPFGGGKHHCIGAGWSIEVTSLLTSRLLKEFQLSTDEQQHTDLTKLSMHAIFLARPTDGFVIEDLVQ